MDLCEALVNVKLRVRRAVESGRPRASPPYFFCDFTKAIYPSTSPAGSA